MKDPTSNTPPYINQASYRFGTEASEIRSISMHASSRKAAVGEDKVFDFSLGNPSTPAPDAVLKSIAQNLHRPSTEVHGYTPGPGLVAASKAVAESLNRRFGTDYGASELYMTCGAAASISIVLHSIINPELEDNEVIVFTPYFPEYRVWIEMAGAKLMELPVDPTSFLPDIALLAAALTKNTRAVLINSPHNPTGVVYPPDLLSKMADVLRQANARFGSSIQLISDEPYRELVYASADTGTPTVAWVPSIYEHTLVCYSYSKSLSLPGERIGWVLVPTTHPDHDVLVPTIAGSGRKLGFVCAPSLFQRVLIDCVDTIPNLRDYQHNRDLLCSHLSMLGFHVIQPEGAFYLWFESPDGDDRGFAKRARAYDVYVVPSQSFGLGGWLRLGYCCSRATAERSLPFFTKLAREYGLKG